MRKHLLAFLFFFLCFILLQCQKSVAQDYSRVTVMSGNQVLRNNTVTVTSAGVVANTGLWAECQANPYSIGLNYNGQPGSFTHTFSSPVTYIRLPVSATNIGELNTLYINGTKYNITATDIDSLKTCDTQYYLQNTASANGELVFTGPIVGPTYYGRFGSAAVRIYIASGINSIRFENNGIMGGSCYGVFFRGIPLFAKNNSDSLCVGEPLKLFADPEIPNARYSWTGPDGFSAQERNPEIQYTSLNSEGWYIAKITTPYDTTYDSTMVKFLPSPDVLLSTNQPLCLGDTLHIWAKAGLEGTTYAWQGPDNFSSTAGHVVIPFVKHQHGGTYSVVPKLGRCNGPVQKIMVDIFEPSIGPTQTLFLCRGDSLRYQGKTYHTEGLYPDTLKGAGSRGCDSVNFLNIVYQPEVPVGIEYPGDKVYCMGDSIEFKGLGAIDYSWRMNGESLGGGNTKTIVLPKLSNLLVVEGEDAEGCLGRDTVLLKTKSCCTIWMPNAFSPNNDGTNDGFGPAMLGPLWQYALRIYNRWGQVVFTSFDAQKKWDGQIANRPADAGTYFYTLGAKCPGNEGIDLKGDFILIR